MPYMEELLNQISTEITRVEKEPLWMSKTDLKYAYGQPELSEKAGKHSTFAITGGNMFQY